jgi:hypothetical protein
VFFPTTDFISWDRWYDGAWHWTNLGRLSGTALGPAAELSVPGAIDVGQSDISGRLRVNTYDTGAWRGWPDCMGGQVVGEPSAVLWPSSQHVYLEQTDRQLWQWVNNFPGLCGGWLALGGVLAAPPAAIRTGTGEDTVFVRGTDLGLWYWSSLTGWHGAGGKLAAKPAALSPGNGPPVAFVEGLDSALWMYSTSTGSWEKIGGRILGTPSAVASAGAVPVDVFVEGVDHHVWHATSGGSGWQWEDLGGQLNASPSVVAWSAGRFDLFARMTDGALWHRFHP